MKTSLLLLCSFIQWKGSSLLDPETQGDVTSVKLQVCDDGGIPLFMKI